MLKPRSPALALLGVDLQEVSPEGGSCHGGHNPGAVFLSACWWLCGEQLCSPHHVLLPMPPSSDTKLGLTPLKPWADTDPSFLQTLCLGTLFQPWELTTKPTCTSRHKHDFPILINTVCYIHQFPNIEPSLHTWNKRLLVMMCYFPNVIFHFVLYRVAFVPSYSSQGYPIVSSFCNMCRTFSIYTVLLHNNSLKQMLFRCWKSSSILLLKI